VAVTNALAYYKTVLHASVNSLLVPIVYNIYSVNVGLAKKVGVFVTNNLV
jgi:hypothetical protein